MSLFGLISGCIRVVLGLRRRPCSWRQMLSGGAVDFVCFFQMGALILFVFLAGSFKVCPGLTPNWAV